MVPTMIATITARFATFLLKATDNAKLKSLSVIMVSPSFGNLIDHKNLHPDIPVSGRM